jgi:hypothetical protein
MASSGTLLRGGQHFIWATSWRLFGESDDTIDDQCRFVRP